MSPRRVILTCMASPWSRYSGGGQRSTHNLAAALARRGHRVAVVYTRTPFECPTPPEPPPYELHWALTPGLRTGPGMPLRPLSAWTVAGVVRRLLGQGSAVVHAQGEEAAVLARRPRTFGLVVTPRYPSLPGALLRPGGPGVRAWVGLALRAPKFVTLGWAARGADLVSPPSAWAGRLVRDAYGLRPERVQPVHNGVPAEFLDYRWQPEGVDRPALFFGRFSRSKGIDTLLAAASLLGQRCPRLQLVGSGPEEQHLRATIDQLGLGARVSVLGWADHHRLGLLLSRAAMAVIPSREENFSLAVLSCMAVGTPLVTTPVGGTPEAVDDGHHGLLVPPDDPQALARAMDRLGADAELARSLGAAAYRRVREEFTWDTAAARFSELYDLLPA